MIRLKNNQRAVVLVAIIMLITLLSIIALPIAVYIGEVFRFNLTLIDQDRALYMAEAGIKRAIVDYNDDGLWSAAQNVNLSGGFYYHLGEDANFFYVDASSPYVFKKFLRGIPIKNINSTDTITITDLVVSWTHGGYIEGVNLGGTTVWSGSTISPASLDISNFAIASDVDYPGTNEQQWKFSNNVSGDIVVTFNFSDGSSCKRYLLKDSLGWNKGFLVKATGEIRAGSDVMARRTLEATYDTGTENLTSWEETQDHIIP